MAQGIWHICHGLSEHRGAWSLMAGGATVACLAHCIGVCALCVSGGTALGMACYQSLRIAARHLVPALLVFGASIVFS